MSITSKVSLFLFIAILMLLIIVFWQTGFLFNPPGFEMLGSFSNVGGLLEGAEVRYRGFRIGVVSKIIPRTDDILIKMIINKGVDISEKAKVKVAFDGLIGEKYIDVSYSGKIHNLYKEGMVLQGFSSAGIVDFIDVGTQNLDKTKEIISFIVDFLTDKKNQQALVNILNNIEQSTKDTSKLIVSLTKLSDRLQNESLTKLNRTINQIGKLTNSANETFLYLNAILKEIDQNK